MPKNTTYRYRYTGPASVPVNVAGQLVRRTDARVKTFTDVDTGETIDVPDVLETDDDDLAVRLEASPIFDRVSGSRKPPVDDDPPDQDEADTDDDQPKEA